MRSILQENTNTPFPVKESQESYSTIIKNALENGAEDIDPTPYLNLKLMQYSSPEKILSHQLIPFGDKSQLETGPEVGSAQLNYINALKQEAQERAAVVNSMPDTYLAKGLNVTGSLLGTALSTVGILSGEAGGLALKGVGYMASKVVPSISSRFASYAIPKAMMEKVGTLSAERPVLSNLVTKAAQGSVKGAIAGSTAMAALTPFQYAQEAAHQDDTSFYGDLKENLKTGFYWGAGGGFAAPFVGFAARKSFNGLIGVINKKVVGTPQAAADALNLAQDQIVTGNKVDVSPLVDNTLYSSKSNISDDELDQAQTQNAALQKEIDNVNNEISSSPKIKSKDDLTTLGVTHKLTQILRKEATERTAQESNYRDNMLAIPYHHELLEAHMADYDTQTPEQEQLIRNSTDPQHEINSIESLVKTYGEEKENLLNTVDLNNDLSWTQKRNVPTLLNEMDKKVNFMKERLSDLYKMKTRPVQLRNANKLNLLRLKRDKLQSYIDKNQGLINVKTLSKPVNQEQLTNAMRKKTDPRNDMDYSESAHRNYQQNYKNTEFNEPESLEDVNKDLVENEVNEESQLPDQEVDEERKAIEDEAMENESHIDNLFDAIKNTMSCLFGGGNNA